MTVEDAAKFVLHTTMLRVTRSGPILTVELDNPPYNMLVGTMMGASNSEWAYIKADGSTSECSRARLGLDIPRRESEHSLRSPGIVARPHLSNTL